MGSFCHVATAVAGAMLYLSEGSTLQVSTRQETSAAKGEKEGQRRGRRREEDPRTMGEEMARLITAEKCNCMC